MTMKPQSSRKNKIDYPLPVTGLASDEITAPRQTKEQRIVQDLIDVLAARYSGKRGKSGRQFLAGPQGIPTQFMAMNSVYGNFFSVQEEELSDPEFARFRSRLFADQFIFDVQTHFVSPQFTSRKLLLLRMLAKKWNPGLKGEKTDLGKVRFENYYREMFEQSDTKLAVLTSAPNDDPDRWFLHNDEMARTRDAVNAKAGRKILFSHALVTPRHPGWMEEIDRAVSQFRPDAWKCYTTGAPFDNSRWPWRLDDEKLVYPAYEKMVKAGIVNVCIHKGLLPPLYRLIMPANWKFGKVDDLPRAARDWPQLNFIVYHSAVEKGYIPSRFKLRELEKTGYIPWVSDLAEMRTKYRLNNIYAELGSTFAFSVISNPRYCAGILGTLLKGMGADHILWGTDSVWYGSPQWQIEAFRRFDIPEDMQAKFGYPQLGPADGEVKRLILGGNAARLYNVESLYRAQRAA
jgi:hypothetical protein